MHTQMISTRMEAQYCMRNSQVQKVLRISKLKIGKFGACSSRNDIFIKCNDLHLFLFFIDINQFISIQLI